MKISPPSNGSVRNWNYHYHNGRRVHYDSSGGGANTALDK